ncbi:MAG: hypothetical protein IPL65_06820 [Lewinellaceae bacterium]|nr:hypothetical protein [Lewinellaceae bacterium]
MLRPIVFLISFLSLLPFSTLQAQTSETELSAIIFNNDSLFWEAYNRCDTSGMKPFLASDLEFTMIKAALPWGWKVCW